MTNDLITAALLSLSFALVHFSGRASPVRIGAAERRRPC